MADFNLPLTFDIDEGISNAVKEHGKNVLPFLGGDGLKTSQFSGGTGLRGTGIDMPSVAEILQNITPYDSPQNALMKSEYLQQQLLGATLISDPNHGSLPTGPDQLVPSDVKDFGRGGQAAGGLAAGGKPGGTGGSGDPLAAADGSDLLNRYLGDRITFSDTTKENNVRNGLVAPNILYVLLLLMQTFKIEVTSNLRQPPGFITNGAHSYHRMWKYQDGHDDFASPKDGATPAGATDVAHATDIGLFVDIGTGQSERIAGPGPLLQRALDVIDTISGPRRPTEVLSAMDGYHGFGTEGPQQNHLHIGFRDWGDPLPNNTSAGASGTKTASGGTVGIT